jgi:hypothetical protein
MSEGQYRINMCSHGGWLVGLHHDADVADPTEYQWESRDPVLPCTRLFCARCKDWVREDMTARDRALNPKTQEDRDSAVRVYRCACRAAAIPFGVSTDRMRAEGEELCLPRVDWFCAGHVAAHLPLVVDGHEVLDEQSALHALEALLHVDKPDGRGAEVSTLYFRLAGSPIQAAILARLRSAILDSEPLVRSAALIFWRREYAVDDHGQLLRAVTEQPDDFSAVDDPITKGATLEDNLMRALARRMQRRGTPTEDLRTRMREYALGSSQAEHMFPAMVEHDLPWVLLNASALASSSARARTKLRMCLRRHGVAVERLPMLELPSGPDDLN